MKKYFQTIGNLKLGSLAIILITIFVVSIFGFQVSKISAQRNSSLGRDLSIEENLVIRGDLNAIYNLGADQVPQYTLDVYGEGNFSGTVDTNTPGESQGDALATVNYIKRRLGEHVGIMPGVDW